MKAIVIASAILALCSVAYFTTRSTVTY
jgi:Cathepsin propeptide inhibitor domain (I29)